MSISTEITRIQTAKNTIRNKLVNLELVESTAKIDECATAVDGIANNGSISAEVKEGETYTIPQGWHNGTGTVSGVAGGGNYSLQSKTVTPTKSQQSITPDSGYYGLSDVSVAAIPEAYQDVTAVDATAADVLSGKKIVDSTGAIQIGSMANNGAISKTLDVATTSVTIEQGYHDGTGAVSIVLEEKSATPTKSEQEISATSGKVISKVTVAAIPDEYQVVTGVTTKAENVLAGDTFVDATGAEIEGTMANNGAVSKTLTTADATYAVPVGYHNGSGTVQIVPEAKSATPTEEEQVITAAEGKVLSAVTVAAIPSNYITTDDADAAAAEILLGKTAYVNGVKLEGTMPNNAVITGSIDGLTTTSFAIPAGYTSGGTVSLTGDIEAALAAI